ncbi:MAG: cytochrome c oxidase accessory protein CcoG [Ignavibacteriales bacterium CG_4_9_14_3_um_filter_30_11]|nr:MAG: cytochrome c oxidase accessory protein CcoG [Ignavibacteriales bacterium CG_4_9_14_3_um_filter_30_11]
MSNDKSRHEDFRDSLSTINEKGERNWIYPKKPSGKFYTARNYVSFFLLLILFITPFIKIKGHPIILFNFLNRNFILFVIPFGPHDFHLFVLAMITIIVFIILFTVVFGRIFCGWACPQTIFMEMVFRKIEYWIEGSAKQQKILNLQSWNVNKILKKFSKYTIFYATAFLISNIFLSYIIGIDELIKIISDPPSEHIKGLIGIIAFSGVFYWVFASFREQVCTMVCPYGRLQGVLLDRDSIVITYDNKRGEPRGKIKKEEKQTDKGDCIDCHLCVDVCPTGIDIRNGIQLECVNCTACIDACDYVMVKINKPKGLIKYDSINGVEENKGFKFTARMKSYTLLLVLLISVLGYLLSARTDYSINILRTPGFMFQEQDNNMVSNIYDLNIVNKTFKTLPFSVKLVNIKGSVKIIGSKKDLEPQENYDSKLLVIIPKDEINKINTPIKISVYTGNKLIKELNTSFLASLKKD